MRRSLRLGEQRQGSQLSELLVRREQCWCVHDKLGMVVERRVELALAFQQ